MLGRKPADIVVELFVLNPKALFLALGVDVLDDAWLYRNIGQFCSGHLDLARAVGLEPTTDLGLEPSALPIELYPASFIEAHSLRLGYE